MVGNVGVRCRPSFLLLSDCLEKEDLLKIFKYYYKKNDRKNYFELMKSIFTFASRDDPNEYNNNDTHKEIKNIMFDMAFKGDKEAIEFLTSKREDDFFASDRVSETKSELICFLLHKNASFSKKGKLVFLILRARSWVV